MSRIIGNTISTTLNPQKFMDAVNDVEILKKQVSDLLYNEIDITRFINNVNTVEIGSTVNSVKLNWEINKTPTLLTLDGSELPVDEKETPLQFPNGLKSNQKWTLVATDERGATDTATTAINFVCGVYYGVYSQGGALDNVFVLSLTRKLTTGKSVTFGAPTGPGQRVAFALPQSFGTPVFKVVDGFQGGFILEKTFEFTNASDHSEPYCIWLSENEDLGNVNFNVAWEG